MSDNIETAEDIYKAKLKKIQGNQGWNTVLDKELVRYQQKAWCYKILHRDNASWYGTLDWGITLLILFAGLGSLFPDQENYIYIVLTGISAGLVGYQKMAGYSKLEQQHYTASNNYSKYVTTLRNTLKLYRRDRPYAKQYIEFISNAYDDLIRNGPPIDGVAIYLFHRRYKKPSIFLPDILSDNIDVLEGGIEGSDNGSDNNSPKVALCDPAPEDDDSENSDTDDEDESRSNLLNKESLDRRREYEISRLHAQHTFFPNFN